MSNSIDLYAHEAGIHIWKLEIGLKWPVDGSKASLLQHTNFAEEVSI